MSDRKRLKIVEAAADSAQPIADPAPPAPGPAEELPAPAPPLELVGQRIVLKKGEQPPAERSVRWWCMRRDWPAWLAAGMAVGLPVNHELSESEAEALARKVASLPLGR